MSQISFSQWIINLNEFSSGKATSSKKVNRDLGDCCSMANRGIINIRPCHWMSPFLHRLMLTVTNQSTKNDNGNEYYFNYTEFSKTREAEKTYQSLTWAGNIFCFLKWSGFLSAATHNNYWNSQKAVKRMCTKQWWEVFSTVKFSVNVMNEMRIILYNHQPRCSSQRKFSYSCRLILSAAVLCKIKTSKWNTKHLIFCL